MLVIVLFNLKERTYEKQALFKILNVTYNFIWLVGTLIKFKKPSNFRSAGTFPDLKCYSYLYIIFLTKKSCFKKNNEGDNCI